MVIQSRPRRKFALRRKRVLKRNYRKRNVRIPRAPKHGGMYLVRKMKQLGAQGSAVAGTYTITPNNCVALGTPVAEPVGISMYSVPFVCTFQLNDVVNASELSLLFDRYRIAWTKIKIQSVAGTSYGAPNCFIEYITDYDDNNFPTVTSMREKMGVNVKYFSTSRPAISLFCKPRPALNTYIPAGTGYTVPNSAPFINMSSDTVPHFAIKGILRNVYLPATAGISPQTWDVTYGLQLRDVQ